MTIKRIKEKDSRTGKILERWQVTVFLPTERGRNKRVRRSCKTQREAVRAERTLLEQAALRRAGTRKEVNESRATKQAPLLSEFVPRFMAHQRAEGNTASTLAEKEMILRVHLVQAFGHVRLDEITSRTVAEYRVDKTTRPGQKTKQGLSPKTVVNHMAVLHRLLTVAKEWGEIDRVPKIPLSRRNIGRPIEFLDFDEAERYLGIVERLYRPEDHLYVLLAMRSGLRTGEMRALQWQQVRLDDGFVLVDRNITDASHAKDVARGIRDNPGVHLPKWNKIRQVPLPWDAIEALKVAKAHSRKRLVFPGSMAGGFRSRSAIEKMVCRAAERGELGKHVHPHMLRHTYASHLVMRGVSLKVVQELLGHATVEMTMRYAHLSVDHKADAVQVLCADRGLRLIDGGQDRPAERAAVGAREVPGRCPGRRSRNKTGR